jgi:hypothetical protein
MENPTQILLLTADCRCSDIAAPAPHRKIFLSSAQRRLPRPNIQPANPDPAEEAYLALVPLPRLTTRI